MHRALRSSGIQTCREHVGKGQQFIVGMYDSACMCQARHLRIVAKRRVVATCTNRRSSAGASFVLSRGSLKTKVDMLIEPTSIDVLTECQKTCDACSAQDDGGWIDYIILSQMMDTKFVNGRLRAEVLWMLKRPSPNDAWAKLSTVSERPSFKFASGGFKAVAEGSRDMMSSLAQGISHGSARRALPSSQCHYQQRRIRPWIPQSCL